MRLDNAIMERIKEIPWFENCGVVLNIDTTLSIRHVYSWGEAHSSSQQSKWEDVTMEARNDLTSFLHDKFESRYMYWNSLVVQANAFIDIEVMPKVELFKDRCNLDQTFVDCVRWDVLNAIMSDMYKKYSRKTNFYLDLLVVYESGHFPCGWKGEYPDGFLLVY